MAVHFSSLPDDLLALCAVLRWFDRDLLVDLGAGPDEVIDALLAGHFVAPALAPVNTVTLREAVRTETLARLRAERPAAELTLHERALTGFRARLERTAPRAAETEAACFLHLEEVFAALAQRSAWQAIREQVAALRPLGPFRPEHECRLVLYEGYAATRAHDYEYGEARLLWVLARPDLEPLARARALNGLAMAHLDRTNYDRALDLLRELADYARATGQGAFEGLALVNMAMVYNELEEHERALALSHASLEIFLRLGEESRAANAHWAAGLNAMYLGRWEVARRHFAAAASTFERLAMPQRLAYLAWCEGYLQHLLGAEAISEAAYRRGLALCRATPDGEPMVEMDLLIYLGFLCETQGRAEEALALYDRGLAIAGRMGHRHRTAQIHYRQGQVLAGRDRLDAALAAYRAGIAAVEGLREVTEREEVKIGLLGTHQQLYEATVLACLARGETAAAFDYVERARSRAFLDRLSRRYPELYAAVDQPVVSLAETRAALPEDGLLIEYFTTGVPPRDRDPRAILPPGSDRLLAFLTPPPHLLIFAITRDGCQVQRSDLNPNVLRPLAGDPTPGRRWLHDHLLIHLHHHLIAPIEPLLTGRRLLYLVPHGPLHSVPFAALHPRGGDYLLHAAGPALATAPSATILLRNCLGRPPSRATRRLVIGYDDRGGDDLWHAETEARRVARLVGGEAWTGAAEKRSRLLAAGRDIRWLHVAGHGLFDPQEPLDSTLRLGDGDALSARQIIDELELDAELVTLSACMSGMSQVVPGDELLGLQRAFLYAGAATVVGTLWEAADLVALLVMERFYLGLQAGQSAAAALRDAQVATRTMTTAEVTATIERWRREDPGYAPPLAELAALAPSDDDAAPFADPFYWAGFVLIGRPGGH